MAITKLTSVDFDNLIILGFEEVYGFNRSTGELDFMFDQIKSGELSGTHDTSYSEGKRGVRLATLKKNKTSKFTCENGYVVASALAKQLGGAIETASESSKVNVRRAEYVKLGAATTVLNLSSTPVDGSVKHIYLLNSDKTKKKSLDPTTDFTIADKVITLKTAGIEGDLYLCVYDEAVTVAKRFVNDGESFSSDEELIINLIGEDSCTSSQYLIQCRMPKASVSGEWSLNVGSDPAVHSFTAEASLDVCSTESELCEFIIC